jgi:hypothetical protein
MSLHPSETTPEVTPPMGHVTLDDVAVGRIIRYRVNRGSTVRTCKLTEVFAVWKDGEAGFEAMPVDYETLRPVEPKCVCWGRLSTVTEVVG